MLDPQPARDATKLERWTWGTCPVCAAPPRSPCRLTPAERAGVTGPDQPAAHVARVELAPRRVRLVAAD